MGKLNLQHTRHTTHKTHKISTKLNLVLECTLMDDPAAGPCWSCYSCRSQIACKFSVRRILYMVRYIIQRFDFDRNLVF